MRDPLGPFGDLIGTLIVWPILFAGAYFFVWLPLVAFVGGVLGGFWFDGYISSSFGN